MLVANPLAKFIISVMRKVNVSVNKDIMVHNVRIVRFIFLFENKKHLLKLSLILDLGCKAGGILNCLENEICDTDGTCHSKFERFFLMVLNYFIYFHIKVKIGSILHLY